MLELHERIDMALDYIETHIHEDVSISLAARKACLSLWYFHRIFSALTGYSVMDYIRKRRLTIAACTLLTTRKTVLDIALDSGYDAHYSFTRAFKRMFGVTPAQFRRTRPAFKTFPAVRFASAHAGFIQGGLRMEPKLITKPEFTVIGASIRTNGKKGPGGEIPQFWCEVIRNKTLDRIPDRLNEACYGMCFDCDETGEFTYMIAQEVKDGTVAPDGLQSRKVPESLYAVFTAKGVVQKSIPETFQFIYGVWLPKSGYECTGTEDFEYYDDRFTDDENSEVDIYVPIVKKN